MKNKFLVCAALLALTGCQTPAPQSVTDSQRPPSSAVRREYIDALRGTIKPGNFVKAEISSVVLLNPEKQIYAYCTRTTERSNPNWSYIGLGLQHNMILYLKKNDYRCHDKLLRYYDFPELRNMKY
ncbi:MULTISPECIES: hypothetical protein [unclassified Rhizobium]|jgi:hypothetical protein|uniref:hypothetical protein n=1 Tax=unclassified Rhizobium TaxID=2613769 RepID=UPI001A97FFBE|nr:MULTISPECIES: hypothetical protein [unclassified Rhizobium]MBX5161658.1 hypothetical protein [Rhizobium sp. NZLR8]MBX5166955.1 hypothetical protein [Rhizobium sp. NZLR4b]MBX5190574.1 hypothetical protein [Rhizobium sp. NZLR3b]MBX5198072.1 hypothetical protein [Rhizobium sp. NZLR10]MBX5203041.1 hypothetical protein [Rhizobium sp. NZLR1]